MGIVSALKIDEHGHSVRGVDIFECLSRDMGLHLMEGTPSAQTILQSRYMAGKNNDIVVYELRACCNLPSRKCCCGSCRDEPDAKQCIVIDLTNLTLIHDVGARMLFEGVKRLQAADTKWWSLIQKVY